MRSHDIFLALIVAVLWGFNFIVMKVGIEEIHPILFVTIRSIFAFFPLIFFVKKPPVSWYVIFALGASIGIFKFLFILLGIHFGLCGPMTSLILQSQAFFTILFAFFLMAERPRSYQIFGMLIAFSGVAFVGYDQLCLGTSAGMLCALGAAASWGISNVLIKKTANKTPINMVSLMVWISIIPPIPLFMITCWMDGFWETIGTIRQVSLFTYSTLLYSALFSGVAGYALWGYLLQKYPTPLVTPFSMLVPIVATIFSVLIFHDSFSFNMFISTVLVMTGVLINQFFPYIIKKIRQPNAR